MRIQGWEALGPWLVWQTYHTRWKFLYRRRVWIKKDLIDFQIVLILMTQNNVTVCYNVKIMYIQKFLLKCCFHIIKTLLVF
jgi:hypothetical protein